ncbi:MAG: hypothetical protein WDO13_15795 [Verrucomicrobiota bacterium]
MRNFLLGAVVATLLSGLCAQAQDDAANLVADPVSKGEGRPIRFPPRPIRRTRTAASRSTPRPRIPAARPRLCRPATLPRCSLGPNTMYPVRTGDHYRVGVWIKPGADFQRQPGTPGVVLRLYLATDIRRGLRPPACVSSMPMGHRRPAPRR